MIVVSGVIVTTINFDIKNTIPKATGIIVSQINGGEVLNDKIHSSESISTDVQSFESSAYGGAIGIVDEGNYIFAENTMDNAISNIYTGSILVLLITIALGGICTYFIADRALKPVKDLNENIKNINENNLLSNLDVQGPKDEIKELTISFNQMMAKLDNAFSSQKRFNSSVAHELKTPLAVIKTNIDVLNDQQDKTVEDYKETLEIVEKSVLNMNNIIETLLDMIRQENASLDDEVKVNELLEDVVDDLSIIAKEKDIKLEYENNYKSTILKANELLLYRGFYNIVENAIKYNKENGKVIILYEEDGNNIKITISDNGHGIPEKEIENIFKPFYRVNKYEDRCKNSLGLGLSLVKSAIEIHGGNIEVSSVLGEGSTFYIRLPIA